MDNKFDTFRNASKRTITLVNPDRRQIAVLETFDAQLTLRFNDISELTFNIHSHTSSSKRKRIKHAFYPDVQCKRMVLVEGIGYFTIQSVVEKENGLDSYKEVHCFSEQQVFQNFGFYIEDRLYKFYDPLDEKDYKYNAKELDSIPSVVGQLSRQLQITVDPNVKLKLNETPNKYYDEWTISYISPELFYEEGQENNICRSFTESKKTFGYDFMVSEVGDKFQTVFDFDFLNHAIKIKLVEQVTQPTNIYLSFDNVVNELQTTEQADDIVTVLNCVGNNLNIQPVNPTGTNYIADFSYYMYDENSDSEKRGSGWMSQALSEKIAQWKTDVDNARSDWENSVSALRNLYHELLELQNEKLYVDKKLEGLETAQSQYSTKQTNQEMTGNEIVTAEDIEVGKFSIEDTSAFKELAFDKDIIYTCYNEQPDFIEDDSDPDRKYITGTFSFDGKPSFEGSFEDCYLQGSAAEQMGDGYLYFPDGDNKTYCKLYGNATVTFDENGNETTTYSVKGFTRYTIYSNIPAWIDKYETLATSLQNDINNKKSEIDTLETEMENTANTLNLQKRFDLTDDDDKKLFFELKNYWIEGEYENQGFAVLDTTTAEEEIDLARQLLEAGEKELAKINQPRFSVTVDAIDFTKVYEFQAFSNELELGKTIVIKKDEGIHYKPALTSITLNLDEPESFELVFSNILRGGDWGFQHGELLAKAESTSRQVSANWQNITTFTRREKAIDELLYNPLSRTLRLARGNMSNQQFVVDETGILGRQYADETHSSFSPKQVRIVNNVLMFTDDSWQTAKTALGEVAYTDPVSGGQSTAYGLAAEVLVGAVIIGNTLYIKNDNNSISLDGSGITIQNPNIPTEEEHEIYGKAVFHADNNGNVYLKGNIDALSGTIGGLTIAGNSISSDNGNFSIDADGYLQAKSGTIGGWEILDDRLVSTDETVGMSSNLNAHYSFWAGESDTYQYKATAYIEGGTNTQIRIKITDTSDNPMSLKENWNCRVKWTMGSSIPIHTDATRIVNAGKTEFIITSFFSVVSDSIKICNYEDPEEAWANPFYFEQSQLPFSVTPDGSLMATKGEIGGLLLDDNRMYSPNFSIGTDPANGTTLLFGDISSPVFSVDLDGNTYIKKLETNTITSGNATLGNINIQGSVLSFNNTSLTMGMSSGATSRTATITSQYQLNTNDYDLIFTLSSSVPGGKTLEYKHWDEGFFGIGAKWVYENVIFTASGATATTVVVTGVFNPSSYVFSANDSKEYTFWVNDGTPYIQTNCSIFPSSNNVFDLGSDTRKWRKLYVGDTSNLSDIKYKESIESLSNKYSDLVDLLRPVRYKLKNEKDGCYCTGLIAQELKEAIYKAGLTMQDVGAYNEFINEDGETECGISYTQLISILIYEIQNLKKNINRLVDINP